jgi:hypothetical protein
VAPREKEAGEKAKEERKENWLVMLAGPFAPYPGRIQ